MIRSVRYGASEIKEQVVADLQLLSRQREPGVLWLNIAGLGSAEVLEQVGRVFGIHRLTVEDIANTHQRPKTERFEGYEYIVIRVPTRGDDLQLTQLSIIVAPGFLLSFEERDGTLLAPVRERILSRAGMICNSGSDFLAYAILDAAIDHFFPILDRYAERLDDAERLVLRDATSHVLPELYAIKEALRECRRAVWPLRDLLSALTRDDHPIFKPETRLHLRDCYDHVNQLLEIIESDRDTATSLMELHVSSVGNRMNEVMKVLTIIATLFIPLSFIAGLYGMNFDTSVSSWNMPELRWRWGYPFALLSMLAVASSMLLFFRRKGWLGGGNPPP